jgi:hypothetical protein
MCYNIFPRKGSDIVEVIEVLLKKLKNNPRVYIAFSDREKLSNRTLLMFAEKYLASFSISKGYICDDKSGIKYKIIENPYGFTLSPIFNNCLDIPEGVISLRIDCFGNIEISAATIYNGVLTYETFSYVKSNKSRYVVMQTMMCGHQQVEQLHDLILTEKEGLYYSIAKSIDKPTALIEGIYNIKESGVVQNFTVNQEIPSLSTKREATYTRINCIMDPYHLHQIYIEEEVDLKAVLAMDQTVR